MKNLSEREQFAIRFAIFDESVGRAAIYRLSSSKSESELAALKDLPACATRWWFSARVQDYYNEQLSIYQKKKENERERIEKEAINRIKATEEGSKEHGNVDYSDPRNQLRKLNTIVANSDDVKDQLDALKLLISKQTEIAPAKKNGPQVRAYLPLSCNDCPLYLNAKNSK